MAQYLSNKALVAEIVHCQETDNVVSDKLARMLMLLVDRLAQKGNWRYYSFNADMRSDAYLQLIKRNAAARWGDDRPNILKFDLAYSERTGKPPNPFAYVTQIVVNVFRRYVKMERSFADLRDNLLIEAHMAPSSRRQFEDELNRSSEPIPVKLKRARSPRGSYVRRSRTNCPD